MMGMIRKIIKIDEDKCDGCGLCAETCHESAIAMADGKAHLIRDDYCDGLGNCLPVCPTGAISFEERAAAPYRHTAGAMSREIPRAQAPSPTDKTPESALAQWPVQIKLVPVKAPYFDGADLLIAADCSAYAYGAFHRDFMRGRITLIGCTKLDDADYGEKLTEIIKRNDIKSVTVARMEVPCCAGMENAVGAAIENSGKAIPWKAIVISPDGHIAEEALHSAA